MSFLFKNQTVNGTSLVKENAGGRRQIQVQGNLDGASIQLEVSQDGLTAVPSGPPVTTEVVFHVDLLQCDIQFALTGAGGSTNVNLSVV